MINRTNQVVELADGREYEAGNIFHTKEERSS